MTETLAESEARLLADLWAVESAADGAEGAELRRLILAMEAAVRARGAALQAELASLEAELGARGTPRAGRTGRCSGAWRASRARPPGLGPSRPAPGRAPGGGRVRRRAGRGRRVRSPASGRRPMRRGRPFLACHGPTARRTPGGTGPGRPAKMNARRGAHNPPMAAAQDRRSSSNDETAAYLRQELGRTSDARRRALLESLALALETGAGLTSDQMVALHAYRAAHQMLEMRRVADAAAAALVHGYGRGRARLQP